MSELISPQKQMLILEKLDQSTDSITSTQEFNRQFSQELGRLGKKSLSLFELKKILKRAGFDYREIEKALEVLKSE